LALRDICAAAEHIRNLGLGTEIVEFCGGDQAEPERGAPTATIGAGKQPWSSGEGDLSERPFCCIVGQADAALVEKGVKGRPCPEQIVDRLNDEAALGELRSGFTEPCLKIGNEGCAVILSDSAPRGNRSAIDAALEIKDRIDPADCLDADVRDDSCLLAAHFELRIELGELVEIAPGMAQAQRTC